MKKLLHEMIFTFKISFVDGHEGLNFSGLFLFVIHFVIIYYAFTFLNFLIFLSKCSLFIIHEKSVEVGVVKTSAVGFYGTLVVGISNWSKKNWLKLKITFR